jgi:hypothetical protein
VITVIARFILFSSLLSRNRFFIGFPGEDSYWNVDVDV